MAAVAVAACEQPQPPGLCGSIPQQTIIVGESVAVDVCFDDPNGDVLSFKVISSNPEIATAAGAGHTVTVIAVSPGNALVTMIATDPTGLKAQQNFRVLVPNRPPEAVGEIADREVMVGDSVVLDVSGNFSEPDWQMLSYSAEVSDSSRLAVSTDGATVTVVAIAKGMVVVTVTAADPGGLSAVQSFRVTVPNRPPVPVGSIAAREIMVDRRDTLDVSPFFSDPDGDPLVFSAEASDSMVVALTMAGSDLTVAALAKGETVVSVTATDDEGLSALQRFHVTVPNRPPVAVDTIPSLILHRDDSVTVDLAGYFSDPDGDALVFAAATSVPGVVAAVVVDAGVALVALAQGEATVTITAIDPEGLEARQGFHVAVANRAPVTTDTFPTQSIFIGKKVTLTLTDYFSDPDGDVLAFAATTSDAAVVTTEITGYFLTVAAVGRGETEVSVRAVDPGGLKAIQNVRVIVPNQRPVIEGPIPSQSIRVGRPKTLDLRKYFSDLDGDALAYTAEISPDGIASVLVTGHKLTIRARQRGDARVRVTATDPDGLAVTQSFALTVPNRRPVTVGTIPDVTLKVGSTMTISAESYFRDPDGDDLDYGAASSDVDVAAADQDDGIVLVAGVGKGTADITITGSDPEGQSTTQAFSVTVTPAGGGGGGGGGNRAPIVVNQVSSRSMKAGDSFSLDLAEYFSDPDSDPLQYAGSSSDNGVATVEVSGRTMTVTAKGTGTANVTATATDPGKRSASLGFSVTVESDGGGGNRAPVVIYQVPDVTVPVGKTRGGRVTEIFSDPDDDVLIYTATSSNTAAVVADIYRFPLLPTVWAVDAVAVGEATITLTATDRSLSTTMSFDVTAAILPNNAPVVTNNIPDMEVRVGQEKGIANLHAYFSDPDGDSMSFDASSSNTAVVRAGPAGLLGFFVGGKSVGSATVTVTATDTEGESVSQDITVTVSAN